MDQEYYERFNHFAFDEVKNDETCSLDDVSRNLAILATLLGSQGIEAYKEMLVKTLEEGLSPIMIKEVVYQATDYIGYGSVCEFLKVTNEIMLEKGIELPLPSQTTTTYDNRIEEGASLQAKIFGEHMLEAWKQGTINKWLAGNCFGDYYTRTGLDLNQREMITFCFLASLGGCEPQLIAHAKGNMNIGNDKEFLMKVVLQCVPYNGYPRSLNAIAAINKACE